MKVSKWFIRLISFLFFFSFSFKYASASSSNTKSFSSTSFTPNHLAIVPLSSYYSRTSIRNISHAEMRNSLVKNIFKTIKNFVRCSRT